MTALALVLVLYGCTTERFLFEVSPERRKCMEEQVSRRSNDRTCGCCNKGFVGASIPGMQEWTRGDDWIRTDSYTTDPKNVVYETQERPSTLVSEVPRASDMGPVNSFTGL